MVALSLYLYFITVSDCELVNKYIKTFQTTISNKII